MADLITPLAASLNLSPTLQINEIAAQKRAKGEKVVHLGFGEAQFPIEKTIMDKYKDSSCSTAYLPVQGLLRLREVIAEHCSSKLGSPVKPEQVIVAPGTKPLLFALFDILEGDVFLPRPSWVSYEPQVKHARKKLFWVETDDKDRHTITDAALEQALKHALDGGGNPRVMLINSPSNPTGRVFTEETLRRISKFCVSHGITLISDEIYSDLDYVGNHPSPFKLAPETTIVTSGMSKTYSAGGWRVGYAIILNERLKTALLAYASEAWSCAASPAQEAAVVAFSAQIEPYRRAAAHCHAYCTQALYRALFEMGLDVAEPQGGFYVYPSFSPFSASLEKLGIKDSVGLARWLLQEFGLASLPGSAFGEDDHNGPPGGRYRLRLASSCLWWKDEQDKLNRGFAVLEGTDRSVAHLEDAVNVLKCAVQKLKSL